MYLSLAAKNVKKSYKDFTIYFLTLSFGVCLFYLFNSVESQGAMLILSESQNNILRMLTRAMDIISVFVAVVLGFLIVYANNFLLKKRKKELGIYLTLGMEKGSLLRIVFYETFFIGFLSLVIGLVSGIVLSHLFSIITASMFKVSLSQFTFIFSWMAFNKTILYFGVIFVIVIVMNMVLLTRHQLVHLIQGDKVIRAPKEGRTWVSLIVFVLSVIILGVAYYVILENGFSDFNIVAMCMILGAIGTYLFFMSLSGLLIKFLKTHQSLYYSHLNMFIFRQFNSRMHSARLTMTIICLMLFLTIGILSTATTISNGFNRDLEAITPYDVTLMSTRGFQGEALTSYLEAKDFSLSWYMNQYTTYDVYSTIHPLGMLIKNTELEKGLVEIEAISGMNIQAISLTDFNRIRQVQNMEEVFLESGETLVIVNNEAMMEIWQTFIDSQQGFEFEGATYYIKDDSFTVMALANDIAAYNVGILILPDEIVKKMDIAESYIIGNYHDNDEVDYEGTLQLQITAINEADGHPVREVTRASVYENSLSIRLLMSYVGLYLGVVFLMSCAAILALGQLSEAADNARQYLLLSKLGVEKRRMNKAVFMNTLIVFMAPLMLALVHSIFGIELVNRTLNFIGSDSLGDSVYYTALFLVIIYGGYFLATYAGVTSIVIKETTD